MSTADDIQDALNRIATLKSQQDQWRQQGLENFLNGRSFRAGNPASGYLQIGYNGTVIVGVAPPGTTTGRAFPLLWAGFTDQYPQPQSQSVASIIAAVPLTNGGYSLFDISNLGLGSVTLTTLIAAGTGFQVKDLASINGSTLSSERVFTVTQNSKSATLTGDVTQVTNPDGSWTVDPMLVLKARTTDPTSPPDGAEWYRSDIPGFRQRINGVTSTRPGPRLGARIFLVPSVSTTTDSLDTHGSLNGAGYMPHKHLADGADTFLEYSTTVPLNDAALAASDWTLKVMWSSTAAGNNVWFGARADTFADTVTAETNVMNVAAAAIAAPAVANTIKVTSFTFSSIPAQSTYLTVLPFMQRTNVGDTNTGQVSVWGVWLEYRSDS